MCICHRLRSPFNLEFLVGRRRTPLKLVDLLLVTLLVVIWDLLLVLRAIEGAYTAGIQSVEREQEVRGVLLGLVVVVIEG